MNKVLFILLLIIACSCGQTASELENHDPITELFGKEVPFEIGRYKGEFACADCSGITTLLEFDSGGKALVSRFYKDRSTEPELTFGRWKETDSLIQFIGHWEQDTLLFRSHEKGLVLLDRAGEYIVANYQVAVPSEEQIKLSDKFVVKGRFFYMADAAVFWLQPDQQPLPVVMNEAYLPLEKSFLLFGEPERNCVRARLVAKIVTVEDMEGRERPHLEVMRLIHIQSAKCDE